MPHTDLTQSLRAVIVEALSQLGDSLPLEICETILIRDGAYCGRRFHTAVGHADWVVEQNQATLYRPDGTIVQVLTMPSRHDDISRAA